MTPKEKAKELVLKYEEYFNNIYTNYKAIKCALIAVDEILGFLSYQSHIKYWQEVKQEIENL
jgi:hypothetical protein